MTSPAVKSVIASLIFACAAASFAIASRLSDQLSVRFKYTFEDGFPITKVQARDSNQWPSNQPPSEPTSAWNVTEQNDSFRIQVDWYY